VKVQILTDRTETIRASVKDVQFELMLTVGLVVMVMFLFLRNFAANRDSQRRRSFVNFRDFWSDVPAGVQPEQSDADGADHLYRIRGG